MTPENTVDPLLMSPEPASSSDFRGILWMNRGAGTSWLFHTSGGLEGAASSWSLAAQCLAFRWPQLSTSFVRQDIQQQALSHKEGNCWGLDNTSFHNFTTVTLVPWVLFNIHLLKAMDPEVQERGCREREIIFQMPMRGQKNKLQSQKWQQNASYWTWEEQEWTQWKANTNPPTNW